MNRLPNQKFSFQNGMKWQPAAGGVNTEWDKPQLGIGDYSNAENVRSKGPGFKLRPGLLRHHTTSLGYVLSMFSHKNGEYFFAQLDDGDVYEASSLPPTAAAGTFGGDPTLDEDALNINGTGDIRPGSWSVIRDNVLFSQGKMQHTIRPADDAKPLLVVFVKSTTAHRIIDEETADITDDVTDPGSTKVSDTLTFTVADEDSLYICTEFKGESFEFDLETIPGGTKTLEFSYFNGDGWTVQSGGDYVDGTLDWAQDGTIYAPIDERSTTEYPTVMFGQSGYWYRFELGSTVAEPTISFNSISYTSTFQLLENVMSPLPDPAVEVQVETDAGEYETYAGAGVTVSALTAGNFIYFSTTDPVWAIYAEVGSTPNTTATTAIDDLDVWDGENWTTVGTPEDLSNGLANTGYISWDRTAVTPRKRAFEGSQYRAYWYRISFTQTLSDPILLAISTLFYYDIATFGQVGEVSTAWRQRGCWTFSKFPRDIYVSQKDRPNVLNGDDYGILIPGDGRYHRVTAMLSFYNELMAFQAEEGKDGGCITLFEGYSPETWGKLLLSTRLGTFSQASVCIIDGNTSVTKTTDVTQTQVGFISKYGIYITDGQQIRDISEPIRNYFDPENDEYIDVGGHHWMEYDRQGNGIRVGLETIQASGAPDVFLYFHLDTLEWTFDTYTDALPTAFCEVTAASGDPYIDSLQYLAAQSAGAGAELIYQCNPKQDYDEEPDGTEVAVSGKVRMEFSGGGNYLEIRELVARFTSDSNYTLTKRVYENDVLDSDETETFTMEDEDGGSFYRERILENVKLNHQFSLELEWENTEEDWGRSPRIYDYIQEIYTNPNVD